MIKNVLFISHSNQIYGGESILLTIIKKEFINKNNLFVVLPKTKKSSLFKQQLNSSDIKNYYFLLYKNLGINLFRSIAVIVFNLFAALQLILLIKKNNIKLIYSNTSICCIGIMVAILLNISHIWHFHESVHTKQTFGDHKLAYIYKILLKYRKNTIIFISKKQKQEWQSFINNNIKNFKIIYNPIKHIKIIKDRNGLFRETLNYGYLGSLTEVKNIPTLIYSFLKIHKLMPATKLILGGDGNQRKMLEKYVENYSLKNSVIFLGHVFDTSKFFSYIDVLILPSLSEAMPLVVIEAMSAKKAVINTINSGMNELFKDKIDCIFINPLSSSDLFNAMQQVIDKEYRILLGMNAFNKVTQYNFNYQFEQSIRSLLD
jgi:glycosyltransferase involved in cell wall biosynthesis